MAEHILITGASGVVGYAALKHFAERGDCRVTAVSRRPPLETFGAQFRSLDLTDASACGSLAAELGDVTHLVYAALYEKPGLYSGWLEADQIETNRRMLENLFEPLARTAAGLRHVTLLQGTKAYGAHVEPMPVPGRERNPRHNHENFYWLQEDYLRDRQVGAEWALTIVRPQVIYGEAQGGNMNALPALGVYAALLRSSGEPLHYPGGVAPISEAVDAELVARMLEWAATEPAAADETFNVTNGDVYSLRNVWPVVADAFGMEPGDDVPMSLAAGLPEREPEWRGLVDRFGLAAPPSLAEFVGQSFIYADLVSGYGQTSLRSPSLVSTIKARQAGFTDCLDTEDMFARLIATFQGARLFPPRRW